MGFNLYFDFAALTVLIFLTFSIVLKKQIIGTSNKIYIIVLSCTFVTAILDIVASLEQVPIPWLTALNTFFLFFRAATAISLFFYACNLGQVYYLLLRRKWGFILLFLPLAIFVGALIGNLFNQSLFIYLPGPTYQRGPFIWIAYAVSYLYLSASLVIILVNRKYHSKAQLTAIIVAFILQVGSSIFQFLVPNVLVEMFVTSLTLLTLSLFMENPEHFIDYKTMNFNFRSFTVTVRRMLDLKESFNVVLIHVTNAASLYSLYPHEQAIAFNRACSASLSEKARKIDHSAVVYYLGSATFAYVFRDRSKEEAIKNLIQHDFSLPMTHAGISFLFNAKTCLVNCPEDCSDATSLVSFATTFFDLTESDSLDVRPYRHHRGNLLFELDHILENAIAKKSFSVYYQGIYSLKQKRFIAAEALLRLKDDDYGTIMPGLMIPYAERRGKIVAISRVVMEKSFDFFIHHLRGKLDYIEINLSPLQLMDPNLPDDISSLAKTYGIKPEEIIFEITEGAAAMEDVALNNNIKALREQGYRIAIDDFGTGYSNLSRILRLDISVLKFDRSMTDLLAKGEQDDAFLGLFSIFSPRGIKLLFEGVETKEVAEKLTKMKADHIQGYYYSKTIPEEEFLSLLEQSR